MAQDTPEGTPEDTPADQPAETDRPAEDAKTPDTGEQAARALTINAQYIKDLSFEAPGSPGVLITAQASAPDIKVNVDVQAAGVKDKTFEVSLIVAGECKTGENTAFIVELTYAGLFTLNLPDEHLKPVLLIECPRILFPFARNIVADITRDGGFPPLMLNPLDFAAMYRGSLTAEQAKDGAATTGEEAPEAGAEADAGTGAKAGAETGAEAKTRH